MNIDPVVATRRWFETEAYPARLSRLLMDPVLKNALALALQRMQPDATITDPVVVTARSHQLAGANHLLTELNYLSGTDGKSSLTGVPLAGAEWGYVESPPVEA